jgi:CBS domain-containing protein
VSASFALMLGLVPLGVARARRGGGGRDRRHAGGTAAPRGRDLRLGGARDRPRRGAAAVGVVATLVWMHAGRAWIARGPGRHADRARRLRPRSARAGGRRAAASRRFLDPALAAFAIVLAPVLLLERLLARLVGSGASSPLAMLRRLGGWLAARPGRNPLDVTEAGLVARIARFAAKTAGDVMVPHVDVCAVPDTASVGDVLALVQERGFSRIPVFHERMFNTIGVVTSHDLLGVLDPHLPVASVMREPLFVPGSKPLPELLASLQAEGRNSRSSSTSTAASSAW